MNRDNLVAWCCMNCEENFYLEKNAESTQILGAINCPYCGRWEYTVMNEIKKPENKQPVGVKCQCCGKSSYYTSMCPYCDEGRKGN